MALSDCPKCWDTPCTCGYEYQNWTAERLTEHIAMLTEVLKKAKSREARKVTINKEQKLYVIPCGDDGYTTLGFANAHQQSVAVCLWLHSMGQPCKVPDKSLVGTLAGYKQYADVMALGEKTSQRTGRKCEIGLHPKLKGKEGKRLAIVYPGGEERYFRVGRSTGWLPCHLYVEGDSDGGEAISPSEEFEILHQSK